MFNIEKYLEIKDFITKQGEKEIEIVSVSKNHSLEAVTMAINNGIRIFGENRVQEAIKKFSALKEMYKDIDLHLTGPLQSNKVSAALKIFDCFQTLDREKLAKEFVKYPDIVKKKRFFIKKTFF